MPESCDHSPNSTELPATRVVSWVFCAEARNERRRRTMSLSERRGRHVIHSFLRAPHIRIAFQVVQRTPIRFQFTHPPRPRSNSRSVLYSGSMMRRARPTAISSPVGPPTRRELALDALPSSSIEKHCVLPPTCCKTFPLSFPSTQ